MGRVGRQTLSLMTLIELIYADKTKGAALRLRLLLRL